MTCMCEDPWYLVHDSYICACRKVFERTYLEPKLNLDENVEKTFFG